MTENPYAPPLALESAESALSEGVTPDLEATRRANFAAEGHVRAVGLLSYVSAFGLVLGSISIGIAAVLTPPGQSVTLLVALVFSWTVSAVLLARGGLALRRVETKGRVFYVCGISVALLANGIIGGLSGDSWESRDLGRTLITIAIAASLWDAKRTALFNAHYQTEVLARTRHLVAPTARWFWWLTGGLGLAFAGGIVLAIVGK